MRSLAGWCAGRKSPRNQNDACYHKADAEQVNRRQAFVESERRCKSDDGETGAGATERRDRLVERANRKVLAAPSISPIANTGHQIGGVASAIDLWTRYDATLKNIALPSCR